ncbi:Alpha/beta hydrolase domain-containing protein 11 [Geranomyces michiganensis]|nr:Alpha/beta hydrolase domain-containing protein 11 [Geranomyces michiganensis]
MLPRPLLAMRLPTSPRSFLSHRTFASASSASYSSVLSSQTFTPSTKSSSSPTSAPLVILHGLFGSKQNWRSLSKALANRLGTDVIPLDLRNHGESFHADTHDYESMAEDVLAFVQKQGFDKINLMGHSMGGKVAMHFALSQQDVVNKLVVVDMAPTVGRPSSDFEIYLSGMNRVEAARVASKPEADRILAETVDDLPIRQFILTNLRAPPSKSLASSSSSSSSSPSPPYMSFRINLPVLEAALAKLWEFPLTNSGVTWAGDALFIAGSKARYITPQKEPSIRGFFPHADVKYLDAGHWVHSEKPEEFMELVTMFLRK